ncbi:hypothetical protein ACWCRA_32725, partial [Streptomyces sp. NPDC001889]
SGGVRPAPRGGAAAAPHPADPAVAALRRAEALRAEALAGAAVPHARAGRDHLPEAAGCH